MKKIKMINLLFFVIISLVVFTSCDKKEDVQSQDEMAFSPNLEKSVQIYDAYEFYEIDRTSCIDTFPYEELSQEEIDALLLMREEEFLAHDVYVGLYPIYNIPVFNNISRSETQHTLMVKNLLDKYELPDPAANHQTGVFENPELQELYNSLMETGSISLLDALGVGALIEDLDIYDLEEMLENVVDNQDITFVFENLCRGSRNHMRAFYGNLVFRGGDYSPQYISQEYFDEIINGSHEPGNGGCGSLLVK
jgi:hypothetical protein